MQQLACSLGALTPETFACTEVIPALPLESVEPLEASNASLRVQWAAADLNDCEFDSYEVQWELGISPGALP